MEPLDDTSVETLSAEELALWEKEQKKFRARMRGMTIFCLILALPIAIGAFLVWRVKRHMAEDRAWAVAELAKPKPDPMAYGALGSILLNEGKVAEALPLLTQAAAIEAKSKATVEAHIICVEAEIEARKRGLPAPGVADSAKRIEEFLSYGAVMPQGRAAAAWHSAGKLYSALGMKAEALQCLKKASEMQPDDWVDEGGGARYKHRGIASIYQKDYSGAQYQ